MWWGDHKRKTYRAAYERFRDNQTPCNAPAKPTLPRLPPLLSKPAKPDSLLHPLQKPPQIKLLLIRLLVPQLPQPIRPPFLPLFFHLARRHID